MNKNRNLFLDIIKIIGTVCILFHHYQQYTSTFFYHGLNFYGGRISFGYVVEVFFLISGWVMVPYVERIKKGMPFSTFAYRRLAGLLPSLIVSTVLYDVVLYIYMEIYNGKIMLQDGINVFGSIITALGMGTWGITPNYYINNVCWYVSVLILCYMIMYFLVLLSVKTRISVFFLLAIPVLAGAIRVHLPITDTIPFYTVGLARGYIHFFGGLMLGILFKRIISGTKVIAVSTDLKAVSIFRRLIGLVASSLLDVYLVQLSVLIMFFIASNHLPIRIVSGKTMLLFAVATFGLGIVYHSFIGRRIHQLLMKRYAQFSEKNAECIQNE